MESSDKENVRMAMLKHEETFRQQVYELHRLYRIQKTLMKTVEESNTRRNEWRKMKEQDLEEHVAAAKEFIEESEIELTLGPSSYYNNQRRKKAETYKQTSDSGPSFSSSSTGSSGHGNKALLLQPRRNYKEISEMGFVGFLEGNSGYQRANINKSTGSVVDVEEEMRLRQHPWLFQAVSLNLT